MNYVIAAWLSCGAILLAYSLRTLYRERSLRRSLAPKVAGPARRPDQVRTAKPRPGLSPSGSGEPDRALAPEGGRTWT
jgi:hypothetical protein